MDSRRAGWPIWRIALLIVLPFAGALAMLAVQRSLFANATLCVLAAFWAICIIAVSMHRTREPLSDVTEPGQRTVEAERQQKRLLAYLNLSPAPLMLLEEGYRLRAVNRAARRLLGAQDVVADPDRALVTAIADTVPGTSRTLRLDFGTGAEGYALATADIVAGGEVSRIAALVGIEAELRAAEARALRNLLNILSHEVMNGLTPIASLSQSAVDLIDTGGEADLTEARAAIATVARRAEGLRGFGEAYRRLARLPDPVMRPVDVPALLADLARLFRNRWPDVALEVEVHAMRPGAEGDMDQLHAALWALLQNAVEACAGQPDPRVTLIAERVDRAIIVVIGDNGGGITEDVRANIFQPFFTTKADGSGVGLALARMIALAHLGDVTLLPDEQPGARFRFAFGATD